MFTFTLTNGTPNDTEYLAYSTTGIGTTFVPALNVYLGLVKPKQAGGTAFTDSTGRAEWNFVVPIGMSGIKVWFQAAQYNVTTNVLERIIN